jgi:hypothetical protein
MPIMSDWSFIDQNSAQLYAELEQFDRDNHFIDDHYAELAPRYRNHWVAVYRGHIVGAAPDMGALVNLLDQKGIPSQDVARRFFPTRPIDVLL